MHLFGNLIHNDSVIPPESYVYAQKSDKNV